MSTRYVVTLSKDVADRLEARALANGDRVSDVLADLIELGLEEYDVVLALLERLERLEAREMAPYPGLVS